MSECAASLRDWRSSPLFMPKQKRSWLYEEAEACKPQTPSTASDDSAEWDQDVLYIEITLLHAVSGKQLGLPQVMNMSKSKNRQMSLGSLVAMCRRFEYETHRAEYSYFFEIDDGERRTIHCASRMCHTVIDYADFLESVPIGPDHATIRPQDRFHRLVLQRYAASTSHSSSTSPSPS